MHLCDLPKTHKESFLWIKAECSSKFPKEEEQVNQTADAAETVVPLPEECCGLEQSPAQDADRCCNFQVPEPVEERSPAVGILCRKDKEVEDPEALRSDPLLQQDLRQSIHRSQS